MESDEDKLVRMKNNKKIIKKLLLVMEENKDSIIYGEVGDAVNAIKNICLNFILNNIISLCGSHKESTLSTGEERKDFNSYIIKDFLQSYLDLTQYVTDKLIHNKENQINV